MECDACHVSWVAITLRMSLNFQVLKIKESCVLFVVGAESEGDVSCRCLQSRNPQLQQKNVEISDLAYYFYMFAQLQVRLGSSIFVNHTPKHTPKEASETYP